VAASETLYLDIPSPEPHRLAYRRWRNQDARETIVCAHGLTRNSHDFDFLAEALAADGFQVIAADMPGRGESSSLANHDHYNNQVYVDDMKALLDHLGVKKTHWIGTSMGGIMAMMLEAQHPGTIQSLALNDIGCILPFKGLASIASYLKTQKPSDEAGLKQWLKDTWGALSNVPDNAHWEHLFKHYVVKDGKGGYTLAYDPRLMIPFFAFFQGAPRDADYSPICNLGIINVPTLLVRGKKSDLLTPEIAHQTQALWNANFEKYEVENSGHAPMLMSDEEVQRIRGWMAQQKTPERFSSADRPTGFVAS